jgi:HAD superfamily hydrolase (TIGR01509 family)
MAADLVVFLDDGGVMNDNERRGGQWQRCVAEFFVPRLGGLPEAWAEANRVVATALFDLVAWEERLRATGDYESFDRSYQIDWLGGMCELVGVPCPPDDEAVALAHEATLYVCRRVHAAFPGVVEAIRTLHARSYRLNTASGESSLDLTGYLEGMGVRDCFDRLYGPDLIATFKSGPAYYERLLTDAGVPPERALIVDDSPKAIAWAASVGARSVLVGSAQCPGAKAVIGSLAELPSLIVELESDRPS